MNQLERIQHMEQLLDFVIEARKEPNINEEKSARIQEATRILADYYASNVKLTLGSSYSNFVARRDGWSRPLPLGAPRPMSFKLRNIA